MVASNPYLERRRARIRRHIPSFCFEAFDALSVTVEGHEYSTAWGSFSGRVCKVVGPGPDEMVLTGTWVATTRQDEWQ